MSVPPPPEEYTYPEDYVPPPPFPSLVSSMTLHVTKGTPPNEVQYTVSIPYASLGENSVAITNQQLTNDFSNKPPGTTYSYHITTNYTPGSFPTGDVITTPTVSNQSVKATPSLYATSLEYNPATEDGYVSQCCSTSSNASINYTIDDANVATIEPGTGRIIPMGTGITELVCSQSSNSEYEQATTRSTLIVSMIRSTTASVKVVPLIRLSNNTTIRYTGNPSNIPNNFPLFIIADIRGTPEWFAIVNNSSFLQISNYARTLQSQFFTPPGQSTPVPFDNIVTTHVTNMAGMFAGASAFNRDISSWDTSGVTSMAGMFSGATAFNRDISSWDTSRVTNMSFMFQGANAFNRPLNNWNTGMVINMIGMFINAVSFNQPLNNWNTSRVINMSSMFAGARDFNQNISNWNTSNVRDMSSMFWGVFSFNQPLENWNTSQVINMSSMFAGASFFNQNISNWNVSRVTNMSSMFAGTFSFNQPLISWDVSNVNSFQNFRTNSALSTQNTPQRFR